MATSGGQELENANPGLRWIASDCANVVSNLPVCANSTWNMYSQGKTTFFCCPPGQYGVLPLRGYAGICEPLDQPVASTLVATAASQVGGAAVNTNAATGGDAGAPTSTVVVTSTLRGGGVTTITTAVSATGISSTTTIATSPAESSSESESASSGTTSSKKKKLSTGAIVGIAIAAFLVLVALIALLLRWISGRKSKVGTAPGYESGVGGGPPPGYGGPAMLDGNSVSVAGRGVGGGGYKTPASAISPLTTGAGGGGYGPGGWNSSTPPPPPVSQGGGGPYGTPPPMVQQGSYGPPRMGTVEAPRPWEGRAEMGQGGRG